MTFAPKRFTGGVTMIAALIAFFSLLNFGTTGCNKRLIAEPKTPQVRIMPVISIVPPEYQPMPVHDTITVNHKHHYFDDGFIARADKSFTNVEEILRMNVEWQKRYMRLADTARHRGHSRDSVYALMVTMREDALKERTEAKAFYKQVLEAKQIKAQSTKAEKWGDISCYTAFGLLIIFLVGIEILQSRSINKKFNQLINIPQS